jgi:hypothetical protein
MLVVDSKEFNENPTIYFNKVDKGVEVLVKRGKNKSYKIVPTVEEDTLMSEEEFFAKIDLARQEIREGKCTIVRSESELKEFLDSL